MIFKNIILVFLGGGLGSVLRYIISKSINPFFSLPYLGTFSVNIIGSLLIGLFIGLGLKNFIDKPNTLLLVTGFCGGFTTFSAFALENINLLKAGDYTQAIVYILSSIILGILAVALGFYLAKFI